MATLTEINIQWEVKQGVYQIESIDTCDSDGVHCYNYNDLVDGMEFSSLDKIEDFICERLNKAGYQGVTKSIIQFVR